jgi:uncharacterized SAM-binding protein YcdF (DUF218 family)
MTTRLVAVLGYSDRKTSELHAVCAARLARAQREADPGDVVLFSGWSRWRRSGESEADLMASAWNVPVRTRLIDRSARTTLGNAVAIARAARRVEAGEVVLVTSSWHRRRASALVRASMLGGGATVRAVTTDEPTSPVRSVRELASLTVLPLLVLIAARTR